MFAGVVNPKRRPLIQEHGLLVILLFLTAILVLLPVGAIFYGATRSSILDPDAHFTLDALKRVYTSRPYLKSLLDTVVMSAAIGLVATVLGATFAWLINRTGVPARRLMEVIILAPLFLSPFIGAVAWATLAAPRSGMLNVAARQLLGIESPVVNVMTVPGVIFVLSIYYTPYGYLFLSATLKNMDPSLEEASHLNGAGIWRTISKVTMPLSLPALAASFFFIAVLSMGIFSVPGLLAVRADFAPLAVLINRSTHNYPTDYAGAAAVGTLLLWFAVAGTYAYRRAAGRERRFVTVTARGYRPREVSLGGWRYVGLAACIVYGLLAVVLPYGALILMSLTPFAMTDFTTMRFTTENWTGAFTSPEIVLSLQNTLWLAVVVPTLVLVLGLVAGWVTTRRRSKLSSALEYIATIPVAIPGIVFGAGMIWFYIHTPLYGTVWLLAVAFTALYLPQSLRLTRNSLVQIDRSLEDASSVNGASTLRTLARITLPLCKPALLSAWIMTYIFTVREISAAVVLYSANSNVLAVLAWNFAQDGSIARAAVVGLMQTVLLVLGVVVARFVFRVKLANESM